VDDVLRWIRQHTDHTDHNDLRLHAVGRNSKAFRGAFRRIGIPKGAPYSHEYDLICQIIYGRDLPDDWKRLVIVKEALHVFDPDGSQVNTPDGVRQLIRSVITPELKARYLHRRSMTTWVLIVQWPCCYQELREESWPKP
jgi:hypothetical protein